MTKASPIPSPDNPTSDRALVRRHLDQLDLPVKISEEEKRIFIHPFNDPLVIAGQGTVAKEIVEQVENDPDIFFIPVGGGGLISGMSLYLKQKYPNSKVFGCLYHPQGHGYPPMPAILTSG